MAKQLIREKELWLLALCIVAFFYRPIFLGESFYYRDIYSHFLGQKRLIAEFIELRELPLWDKYLHGGQPYLADISNGALYPFNLMYAFLPFFTAFNLIIVIHFMMNAIFSYIFSRIIGLSPISSFIVGIIYSLCGPTLSLIDLQGFLLSMPYLPLTLLCWHLFLSRNQKRWFGLTVLFCVMRVLAGAPELNILGMVFLLIWSLCYSYSSFSVYAKLFYWIGLNIFTLGMSAIQLLPFFEMLEMSSRGVKGVDYAGLTSYSFFIRRLPEFVFSKFFGLTDTIRDSDYWGGRKNFPLFPSVYYGGIVIFLTMFAGVSFCRKLFIHKNIPRGLFLVFFLSTLFSLGKDLPFFSVIYPYIPFIQLFRGTEKMILIGIFPVALLTGIVSEYHFATSEQRHSMRMLPEGIEETSPKRISPRLMIALWVISLCLLAWWQLFIRNPFFNESIHRFFFYQAGNEISSNVLRTSFFQTFCFLAVTTLLYQFRATRDVKWPHAMLAILISADIIFSGASLNLTITKNLFSPSPIVPLIEQYIGQGKFYREPTETVQIIKSPANFIAWGYRWNLTVLDDHISALYKIPSVFHRDFNGLANIYVMQPKRLLRSLTWEEKIPILSAAGVSVIMTEKEVVVEGVEKIASFPNSSNIIFQLYLNNRAVPPIEIVHSWKYASSDNDTIGAMLNIGYDPQNQVIIQLPKRVESFFKKRPRVPIEMESPPVTERCQRSNIQVAQSLSSSIVAHVANVCDGYLVFPVPFYPGWTCIVDGQSTPLVRANFAFSAAFLPAGDHTVAIVYRPASVVWGGIVSLGTCGILLGGAWRSWRKKTL